MRFGVSLSALICVGMTFLGPAAFAGEKADYCRFLLEGEARLDADAAGLVKGVYNLLADEFSALQKKADQSDEDIDAIVEFDAGQGLQGDVVSAARVTSVSLGDIETGNHPVSYGVQDRRVRGDALKLGKSQRSAELGRLYDLARAISNIPKKGGTSRLQFAKVYRGEEGIKKFLKYTARAMRRDVRNTVSEDELDSDDVIAPSDNTTSISLMGTGFTARPVSETRSKVQFSVFDTDIGPELTLPNWVVGTLTPLFGVWVFPGSIGVDISDSFIHLTDRVNTWLGKALAFGGIAQDFRLSSQMVYSGTAVGGYFFWRIVDRLKKRFGGSRAMEVVEQEVAEVAPAPAPPPMKAVDAQYFAVVKMLIDLARGDVRLKAGELVHWGTNYRAGDHTLAFDLLMFSENGKPVVVAVNREI